MTGEFAAIETSVLSEEIQVYPNPTSSSITLEGVSNNEAYQIIDVLGQVVQQGTIANGLSVNVESLTRGTYFIKLGNSTSLRFIKD